MGHGFLHCEMQVTTWLAHMGYGHLLFLMQGEPLMSLGERGYPGLARSALCVWNSYQGPGLPRSVSAVISKQRIGVVENSLVFTFHVCDCGLLCAPQF